MQSPGQARQLQVGDLRSDLFSDQTVRQSVSIHLNLKHSAEYILSLAYSSFPWNINKDSGRVGNFSSHSGFKANSGLRAARDP